MNDGLGVHVVHGLQQLGDDVTHFVLVFGAVTFQSSGVDVLHD